MNAKVDVY